MVNEDFASIKNDLVQAKTKADKGAEEEAEENRKKQVEEKVRQAAEKEEVEGVKSFIKELGDSILENQIAEWRNPDEEDHGENYFALIRDGLGVLRIKLWSNNIGMKYTLLTVEEIQTVPLARMIKQKFKWIDNNKIKPVIRGTEE